MLGKIGDRGMAKREARRGCRRRTQAGRDGRPLGEASEKHLPEDKRQVDLSRRPFADIVCLAWMLHALQVRVSNRPSGAQSDADLLADSIDDCGEGRRETRRLVDMVGDCGSVRLHLFHGRW